MLWRLFSVYCCLWRRWSELLCFPGSQSPGGFHRTPGAHQVPVFWTALSPHRKLTWTLSLTTCRAGNPLGWAPSAENQPTGKVDEQEMWKWTTEGPVIKYKSHWARIISECGSTQKKRTGFFILRGRTISAYLKLLEANMLSLQPNQPFAHPELWRPRERRVVELPEEMMLQEVDVQFKTERH